MSFFTDYARDFKDQFNAWVSPQVAIRAAYDVIASWAGIVLAFGVSGMYTLENIRASDSTAWLPFALIMPLMTLGVFWWFGVYTSLRMRHRDRKLLSIVVANTLVFATMAIVLSFFKVVTFAKIGAYLLAYLFSLAFLIIPRLVRDMARREIRNEESDQRSAVLVIGGGGYIGSALVPRLLDAGREVVVLDLLAFGDDPIKHFKDHPNVRIVREDFRNVETLVTHIRRVGSVIHLGGLVGDPACAVDEGLTVDINVTSTRLIAELSKAHGVKRFVFASSCSIYGASDEIVDETADANPQSLYAKSKVASEIVMSEMADDTFGPVYLRFGTIFGLSGRTRFDLVVNLLSAKAVLSGDITVFGSDQWRPFVHVDDVARAVELALNAPARLVANQAFNVGSNAHNYTLMQLAERIKSYVPTSRIVVTDENVDRRNYRVNFTKIERVLGFTPKWSLDDGIKQVVDAVQSGAVKNIDLPQYSNLKLLRERGADLFKRTYNHGWEDQYLDQVIIAHTAPELRREAS